MSIKVGYLSLGCAKNQMDLELMLGRLAADEDFVIVDEDINADVMIVNTCAFIQSAKEESIESILDLDWLKKNRSLKGIIVTGCMAQRYFEEIKKDIPEVDAILGLGAEQDICETVRKVFAGQKLYRHDAPEALCIEGDRAVIGSEYSAYLRIAEGCDNRCSYCAIPSIRGKFRSRRIEDILAEAKDLYDMGVKELCLIAQDTSRYGLDLYGTYSLDRLLEALCTSPDFSFEWIRVLYCYPDKITDSLISVMKKYDSIVKYIDIPIQHISDRMLTAMNRHGSRADIEDAVKRLRAAMPDIVLRTTVMVGFPGERDSDFKELLDFVGQARFNHLGAFEYSREEGTEAYGLKGQVSAKTKAVRLDNIMNKQYTVVSDYLAEQVGKTVKVLCEGYDPVGGCFFGRSAAFAPEVDGRVYFTAAQKPKEGDFVNVRIQSTLDYDLVGVRV